MKHVLYKAEQSIYVYVILDVCVCSSSSRVCSSVCVEECVVVCIVECACSRVCVVVVVECV